MPRFVAQPGHFDDIAVHAGIELGKKIFDALYFAGYHE